MGEVLEFVPRRDFQSFTGAGLFIKQVVQVCFLGRLDRLWRRADALQRAVDGFEHERVSSGEASVQPRQSEDGRR